MIKNNKGITLVSLIITIVLMMIISVSVVNISLDRFDINSLKKMINDIELLEDKVSSYYLRYGGLPVLRDTTGVAKIYDIEKLKEITTLYNFRDSGDNEVYYILDLNAMEGISLNYGEEGFDAWKTNAADLYASKDLYIINEKSQTIYYVEGIALGKAQAEEVEGVEGEEINGIVTFHFINASGELPDIIPPSAPQIKVISGTKANYTVEGSEENATIYDVYKTAVDIEIIPGKDNGQLVPTTLLIQNKGETLVEINAADAITTSQVYTLDKNGKYTITAKSNDGNFESLESKTEFIIGSFKVGDTVTYDEGTKTITLGDTNKGIGAGATKNSTTQEFTMTSGTYTTENLEWTILGVNNQGEIELISTNPTSSTVCLAGQNGWLYAESEFDENGNIITYGSLDDFCNQLYGTGTGAKGARSLNANDVNKLITTGYNPTNSTGYGKLWQYKYSTEAGAIQYRNSSDGGITWDIDWTTGTNSDGNTYDVFKEPGKDPINSTTTGEEDIANLKYTIYSYNLAQRITSTIEIDGNIINMSDFLLQGKSMDGMKAQWLSTKGALCSTVQARFSVATIYTNGQLMFDGYYLWSSTGTSSFNRAAKIRPIVTLSSDIELKIDENGVWQIEAPSEETE